MEKGDNRSHEKMEIRKAHPGDAGKITELLAQLDYPAAPEFVEKKINELGRHSDEELIVGESAGQVVAVLSLHFIPQLAVAGDFARISYFCVDELARNRGIGRRLEQYCEQVARARGCDRIEVHSHSRRLGAHRFYARLGYSESPKYLIKRLT